MMLPDASPVMQWHPDAARKTSLVTVAGKATTDVTPAVCPRRSVDQVDTCRGPVLPPAAEEPPKLCRLASLSDPEPLPTEAAVDGMAGAFMTGLAYGGHHAIAMQSPLAETNRPSGSGASASTGSV